MSLLARMYSWRSDYDRRVHRIRNLGDGLYILGSINYGVGGCVRGVIHTNTIEDTWSQFKRGIISVYHQISSKHLQRYLDKFIVWADSRSIVEHERMDKLLVCVTRVQMTYLELTAE